MDGKLPDGIGKDSLLHILDVRAVDSQWDIVFRLAHHGTGVATDAFAIVNDETVIHCRLSYQQTFLLPFGVIEGAWSDGVVE
jgi:hypothetical protein